MAWNFPARLAAACHATPARKAWLERLPGVLDELVRRWELEVGAPFESASCAWAAPAARANGVSAVLKIGMPHMESRHEIQGLRFWNGDPTVRLLEADEELEAMLEERCIPGTPLSVLAESGQDVVIAGLLRRLWRTPPPPHPFRPLSAMTDAWEWEALAGQDQWPDPGLVRAGLRLLHELPRTAKESLLLATDLHAGNVLQAERNPWLVIDPKPFTGDPAYDATQHLFNCVERLRADPPGTIGRVADLLGVDRERVRLWMFARAAAEPRDDWADAASLSLARALAP